MSVSLTRSNETDSYDIMTSYSQTSQQTEFDIVTSLVQGSISTVSGSWDNSQLSSNYINTSAISNYPSGTVTKNSAISLEHTEPSELQSYTANLGNNNTGNSSVFQMSSSSAPVYNSNVVVTQSYLPNSFDNAVSNDGSTPENALYKVVFDQTNSSHRAHHAANSRWNSKPGPYASLSDVGTDPIAITENVNHNTNLALGEAGTSGNTSQYATISSDGSVTFTNVSSDYNPVNNNLLVTNRSNFNTFNVNNDIGTFRVNQSLNNSVQTTINTGNGAVNVNNNSLLTMPIMDANANGGTIAANTGKNSLNAPGIMTHDQFSSMFNADVLNTVSEGYNFTITITSNDGGYSINPNDENLPNSSNSMLSSLDNSNLLDNPYYMANYVTDDHEIVFYEGSVTVAAGPASLSSTVNLITIDLTDGETLTQTYAGVNGQIKINPNTVNTRTTDVVFNNMSGTVASDISVYYQGGSNVINADMMTNQYLAVNYEKVALNSSNEPAANVFLSSNGAFMTLYTSSVVNNEVDSTGVAFSFNGSLFNDDSVRLWRVDVENNLVSQPDSFYAGYDYVNNSGIDLVTGPKVNSSLTNLTESNLTYESYLMELNAKGLSEIPLGNNLPNNWTIGYSNVGDTYLKSSSNNAFSLTQLPKYDSDFISSIENGDLVYFSLEYQTITSNNYQGGLQDYITVSYSLNSNLSDPETYTIHQSSINRTYAGVPVNSVTPVSFPYSFTSHYTSENFELVQVVATSNYDVSFPLNFGTYSNIQCSIAGNNQVDTYFTVRNKNTQQLFGSSSLKYVLAPSQPNLKEIDEVITAAIGGSLIHSGSFNINNLKPFSAVVKGLNSSSGLWETLSNSIDFDTYYALDNIHTLTIATTNGAGSDVITNIDASIFNNVPSQNIILDQQNYYIPFVYNPNNVNYTVSSFVSSPSNIPNTTDLSSPNLTGYFTVTDNYACTNVSSWSSSGYSVVVTDDAVNNTTTLQVLDSNSNVVFSIVRNSNLIYLGQIIVTNIDYDVWRSGLTIGPSSSDNDYSEVFESTSYSGNNMGFSNVPGIVVNVDSLTYDAGCNMSFRVLGDFLTINEVGSCADPTSSQELGLSSYNSGSLEFQYVSGDNFSAVFTVAQYRGYQQQVSGGNLVNGVQTYTIVRDVTSVSFNVGDSLTQVLTSNMYYNQLLTVDNLLEGSTSAANLNITTTALYSIPPTGALLTYPVTVQGDTVVTAISNPNYTGGATNISVPPESTPVVNPNTYSHNSNLKTFGQNDMYTFSGIFDSTSQLVALRPSRVKLSNSALSASSLIYSIKYQTPPMNIYKAIPQSAESVSYLGNPESIGSNDPDNVDPALWQLVVSLETYADKLAGFSIGRKTIKQDPTLSMKHAVSYFTSVPTQYIYEAVSTDSNLSTPYDYSTLSSSNKQTRHLFYDGTVSMFNPFAAIINIKDVVGNSCNITSNSATTNNITITHLQPKSVLNLVNSSDNTRRGIIVAGIVVEIYTYSGFYPSNLTPHLVYEGPVTSLPTTLIVTQNTIVFRNRNNNGSINFSIAQYPTDIGYPSGLSGYQLLYNTTNQSEYYNLDFNIGNVLWSNDNSPVTYFNASADGIIPTLYTVVDLNDPATQVNSRRVYKYTTSTVMSIDSESGLQTLSMLLNGGRQYCDYVVSQPPLSNTNTYIWNYADLVANTDVSGSIIWTDDASFNTISYVSWAFGNSVTSVNMPTELFYIVDNSQQKWVFITLLPFQTCANQYGLTVSEISWDGSVYTPMVATRVVNLQPLITNPLLSGANYTTEQYSVSSLNN